LGIFRMTPSPKIERRRHFYIEKGHTLRKEGEKVWVLLVGGHWGKRIRLPSRKKEWRFSPKKTKGQTCTKTGRGGFGLVQGKKSARSKEEKKKKKEGVREWDVSRGERKGVRTNADKKGTVAFVREKEEERKCFFEGNRGKDSRVEPGGGEKDSCLIKGEEEPS